MKRYKELKSRLRELDIDTGYLAELLGISKAALYKKMAGYAPWHMVEAYKVMRIINEPLCMFTRYFREEDVNNAA